LLEYRSDRRNAAASELLLSADAVPEDRRVLYALLFLLGVRFGEAAGLRWRDLDGRQEPSRPPAAGSGVASGTVCRV